MIHYRAIVCLGDSITASGWPGVLRQILHHHGIDVECINAGVRGNTSTQALRRLDQDVLARSPELVIIQFGFNDCNQVLNSARPRTSKPDFGENIRLLVNRVKAGGAEPLLIANHHTLVSRVLSDGRSYEAHSRDYSHIVATAAADLGTRLLDMREQFPGPGLTLEETLLEDGIHLGERGISAYAQAVANFLIPEIQTPPSAADLRTR